MNVFNGREEFKLFSFSFILCLITYGFALSNFTISVDNEMPVLPEFGMEFGRWGQNFIRYHLFKGHLQYFTLLFSLFIFSLAAVRFTKLFRFAGVSAYFFCALFLTFPQISYQVVFSIMADVAALGILFSLFCVELFITGIQKKSFSMKLLFFVFAALLLMFTLSIYQAFILVPVIIYLVFFLQNTYCENYNLKAELRNVVTFGAVMVAGLILYIISVKLICPPIEDASYLMSFMAGEGDNQFLNFLSIWFKNLIGSFYYGERAFVVAFLASVILLVTFLREKRLILLRILTLLALLLFPFIMSAFITNGYHPPRLYLTTNLIFAFFIVFALQRIRIVNHHLVISGVALILIFNIYFVTNLFSAVHQIYKHDRQIAENMDDIIRMKYPDFHTTEKTVYFHGHFPYDYHQKYRLDNSEIFSGSFYTWDNGSNYRIINFIREADVAEYNMMHTHEQLNSVKDSVAAMPVWPDYESIKRVNDIVIIKLGEEKGAALYFE